MSTTIEPSHYQKAIIDWGVSATGSAVVEAVAGSGKTTTLLEVAKIIPDNVSALFVAFNKSIADNLKSKLPIHIQSKTLNSLGYQSWLRYCGTRYMKVEGGKVRTALREIASYSECERAGAGLTKLISLAKHVGLVPEGINVPGTLVQDTDDSWLDLIEKYALDIDDERSAIQIARAVLTHGIKNSNNLVDYDDQIYLPVVFGVKFDQYDWVVVDELQDCDDVQREMLKASLKPGGRFLGVGDRAQSLYGFRGANPESFQRFIGDFNCIQLPLSISYRCAKKVIAHAKAFVSHIEHHEGAHEGHVENLDSYTIDAFRAGDAIICRMSAPIIGMAYKLIKARIPCKVLGRDIATGLIALVKKMKATTIDELDEKLDDYRTREVRKALKKDDEAKAQSIDDRVSTLEIFLAESKTIEGMIQAIQDMFSDGDETKGVILSTIHKAKGLEFDHVYYLEPDIKFRVKQQWQKDQERNCKYVAITRAKRCLYYIKLKGLTESSVAA